MKKIISLLILLNGCFISFAQNEAASICRLGFAFEISTHSAWGANKPVVLNVTPNSSAAVNGIQVFDIIEEINGKKTENQTIGTINEWLQSNQEKLTLTVSNLKRTNRNVTLTKLCTPANALNEKDLASIYAFYSLEDAQTQMFACPFKVSSATSGVNLESYKTFGFAPVDKSNQKLEEIINASIRAVLEEKGLKFVQNNPDLIINTYYSFNKNPNYDKNNTFNLPTEYRYDFASQKMVLLPIYYNPLIDSKQAEYLLNFGIRFADRKHLTDNKLSTVWECEANELIQSGNYTLEKYAVIHIPLILMQYPYVKSNGTVKFYYSHLKYNYTGINYNIDKLKEIANIDRLSPASKSELQIGDKILKINNIKFNDNPKSADSNYKQFIYKTMKLRDPKTQYTNANGFTKCMFWDKFKYAEINQEFMKSDYNTTFSYLFYFEPYINLSGTNIITFLVERDKKKIEVKIKPVIETEDIFEIVF